MNQAQRKTGPADAWTLYDQHRMRVYGGAFGSEHEAWQGRDKALLPSHIIPKRRADIQTLRSKWYDMGYQRGYSGSPWNPPKGVLEGREQFAAGVRDGRADYEREHKR